jgi:hypothetical protein
LIAGALSFQRNTTGLNAIRNEWLQATDFQTRVDHLMGAAGGVNGAFVIDADSVEDDLEVDLLIGYADRDWFWADESEVKDLTIDDRRDP